MPTPSSLPLHNSARSACATTNHTFATNDHACLPPQTAWSGPPHHNHPKKGLSHPFNHNYTNKSLTATPQPPSAQPYSSLNRHPHTGAHLLQPHSEVHEGEDRCFRVSMARRLMLPHPAAPDPAGVAPACSNKSGTGQTCGKPVDPHQHYCYGCRYGGGVDRRHAAVTRCLADVHQTHSNAKVYIEQTIPGLARAVPTWTLCLIKSPRT